MEIRQDLALKLNVKLWPWPAARAGAAQEILGSSVLRGGEAPGQLQRPTLMFPPGQNKIALPVPRASLF